MGVVKFEGTRLVELRYESTTFMPSNNITIIEYSRIRTSFAVHPSAPPLRMGQDPSAVCEKIHL